MFRVLLNAFLAFHNKLIRLAPMEELIFTELLLLLLLLLLEEDDDEEEEELDLICVVVPIKLLKGMTVVGAPGVSTMVFTTMFPDLGPAIPEGLTAYTRNR